MSKDVYYGLVSLVVASLKVREREIYIYIYICRYLDGACQKRTQWLICVGPVCGT